MRRAVPSARTALAGALLWGAAMGLSAGFGIAHWASPSHAALILLVFAAGAAPAFPAAIVLAEVVAGRKGRSARFAAFFLALACGTIGLTAALFALNYRAYYESWHEETFSHGWVMQFAFTTASAFYQFAVIGLRLYFPFGLAALFAAALWFARRAR